MFLAGKITKGLMSKPFLNNNGKPGAAEISYRLVSYNSFTNIAFFVIIDFVIDRKVGRKHLQYITFLKIPSI